MTSPLFALAGIALFVMGLVAAIVLRPLLRRIIAVNVCGAGLFLLMVALAYRGPTQAADALLHALVLTGIVVAISATALALAINRQLARGADE